MSPVVQCFSNNRCLIFVKSEFARIVILLAPVVRKLDSAIYRINRYPEDKYYDIQLRYPVDSNLSSGQRYPPFEQLGPALLIVCTSFKWLHSIVVVFVVIFLSFSVIQSYRNMSMKNFFECQVAVNVLINCSHQIRPYLFWQYGA